MPIRSMAATASDQVTEPQPEVVVNAQTVTDHEPKAKPKRRTKKELIAAAEIPSDGTVFAMKDKATGAEIERAWPEAASLFLLDKADFVDTADRYRAWKLDQKEKEASSPTQPGPHPDPAQADAAAQQRAEDPALEIQVLTENWLAGERSLDQLQGPASPEFVAAQEEMRQQIISLGGQDPASDEAYAQRSDPSIAASPPDAQLGDEVRIGAETYRVGHGGTLTSSLVAVDGQQVKPHRRWQRELGGGTNGRWESTIIGAAPSQESSPGISMGVFAQPNVQTTPSAIVQNSPTSGLMPGESETVVLPITIEQVGASEYRVGTGLLEKIGLPEYSALQIGPTTCSRNVVVTDGGDLYQITREDGSIVQAPKAVVDAILACSNIVEIASRIFRKEAMSFLAAAKPGSVDLAGGRGNQ